MSNREIMVFGDPQTELTMSSLDIAEYTGKRHHHILDDIEKLNDSYEELAETKIRLCSYTDSNNRQRPCYHLNKKQVLTLVSGYNQTLRIKIINRLEELEEQLRKPNPSELSRMQILQMAIESEEGRLKLLEVNKELESDNEMLATDNEIMTPKVIIYDQIIENDRLFDMNDVSKFIKVKGLGRNNLFRYLRSKNILLDGNKPKQQFIDRGYFETKISYIQQMDSTSSTTYVTAKGIEYIIKVIQKDSNYDDNKRVMKVTF